MNRALLLAALVACTACRQAPAPAPAPFPALPEAVHSAAGLIPVLLVDTIGVEDSTAFVIGRFDLFTGRIYIRRSITDPVRRRMILEHERCHLALLETGLHNHTSPAYLELLCNAWATSRVAELVRGRP